VVVVRMNRRWPSPYEAAAESFVKRFVI